MFIALERPYLLKSLKIGFSILMFLTQLPDHEIKSLFSVESPFQFCNFVVPKLKRETKIVLFMTTKTLTSSPTSKNVYTDKISVLAFLNNAKFVHGDRLSLH